MAFPSLDGSSSPWGGSPLTASAGSGTFSAGSITLSVPSGTLSAGSITHSMRSSAARRGRQSPPFSWLQSRA